MKRIDRDKVDNAEEFSGSAIVYALDETGNLSASACDYEVVRDQVSNPEQLRCNFLFEQTEGRGGRSNDEGLDTEILVLLGREASARMVVAELRRLIRKIAKTGLLISESGNGVCEKLTGKIVDPSLSVPAKRRHGGGK